MANTNLNNLFSANAKYYVILIKRLSFPICLNSDHPRMFQIMSQTVLFKKSMTWAKHNNL